MRLGVIVEGRRLGAADLVARLRNMGFRADSYSPHVVSLRVGPGDLGRVGAVVKHARWQLHNVSDVGLCMWMCLRFGMRRLLRRVCCIMLLIGGFWMIF